VNDRISSPETPELHARVYTSPFGAFEQIEGSFSPTTSTLLVGRQEAVLIDAQHLKPEGWTSRGRSPTSMRPEWCSGGRRSAAGTSS
jgi:hypothetical protein